MKKLILILLPVLLVGCGNQQTASTSFIAKNKRIAVQPISGQTLTGTTFMQPVGKVTVINVWASWCAPCRAEAPTLVALADKYSDVQFVGILTRDNESTAKAFVKRFNVNYPSIVDDLVLLNFQKVLPANAIPTTLVLDKQSKVAGRISGAVTVGSLSKLIEKVNADG